MQTLENYLYGKDKSWGDEPTPIITNISGSLIIGSESTITVTGFNFISNAVALIVPVGTDPFVLPASITVIENIFVSPVKATFNYTPQDNGQYSLYIFNGEYQSNATVLPKAIAPITTATTIEEMRSQSMLSLLDKSKLLIGNNPDAIADLDLLYYKNAQIKFNDKGGYINSKGYIIAASLGRPEEEIEEIDFIFYSGNDSNYLVFGYAALETWNLNSNDYNLTEHSFRYRNQRGCYYQHGLFESGRSSTSFVGYIDFDRDYFYRLAMPTDRDRDAELWRLESGNPEDWLKGKFKQKIPQAQSGDRIGKTLYPYFGNYNRSTSPIAGILVR